MNIKPTNISSTEFKLFNLRNGTAAPKPEAGTERVSAEKTANQSIVVVAWNKSRLGNDFHSKAFIVSIFFNIFCITITFDKWCTIYSNSL